MDYTGVMRATRAIIRLDNFRGNFRAVRERVGPDRGICVPVKAGAYGHGAVEIAHAAVEAGAACLAVAAVAEGAELREGGIRAPVLLFSQPLFEEIPGIIENRLTPFVSDRDFAEALHREAASGGLTVPVHLKIDTGMGRMGCPPEEAPDLARHITGFSALEYRGTATHLAVSDSAGAAETAYTRGQIARFNQALEGIRAAGLDPGIAHAANSGAVLLHPEAWFDMVRPGILLYGYKTAPDAAGFAPVRVKPVMELRSAVVFIKPIRKGESVSYGRTWTAPEDTVIGALPLGYADGLPRLASNKWQALIRGKRYPLAGRICMDQCLVDLGPKTEVRRWDEAFVFGGPAPDAASLAEITGTIPYEITCGISKRVPRIYL